MENENQNGQAPDVDNYPLDEATIGLLADILKAQDDFERQPVVQQVRQATISFDSQRRGVLLLFTRQHKLEGNWTVAENGKELAKVKQPAGAPTPA